MRPPLRRDRRAVAPAALAVGVVVVLAALSAVIIASAPAEGCRVHGVVYDGLREGTPSLGGAVVRILLHSGGADRFDPVLDSVTTPASGVYDLRTSCGPRGIGQGYQLVANAPGHHPAVRSLPFAVDGPVDLRVDLVLTG